MPFKTAGNALVTLRFVLFKGHMAWNKAAGTFKQRKNSFLQRGKRERQVS